MTIVIRESRSGNQCDPNDPNGGLERDARLWLRRAIQDAKQIARYDLRETRDVYAALRTLGRLTALRGEAIVREYREYLKLAPERVCAIVAEELERERLERLTHIAGFPLAGAQAPMEASL